MSKLVSVLMPTRGPQEGLIKALSSLRSTATNWDEVEILLRVDNDDWRRIDLIPELESRFGARVIVGPRGIGYLDMGRFVDDLLAVADGKWSWLFDDDSWVQGNWQSQLQTMTPERAVNAQYYQLGGSRYENHADGGPVGLIVPTDFARTLRPTRSPVDQTWLDAIIKRGWHVQLMNGVTYFHDGRPR